MPTLASLNLIRRLNDGRFCLKDGGKVLQVVKKVGIRQWFTEIVALENFTAMGIQPVNLVSIFGTLNHDILLQFRGQINNCASQGGIFFSYGHTVYEGFIDLDHVNREVF